MTPTQTPAAPPATPRALRLFALAVAVCTGLLVFAGGLVTSTGAGLAVPDWPLSYGELMPPMVGNVRFEHGHRMVASAVGFLTVVLAVWLWRREHRRSVRRLGWFALGAVVLQGLLGGLTVLLFLPAPISVAHGTLGQTFFCITVAIALMTSRGWQQPVLRRPQPEGGVSLHVLAVACTLAVYAQLVLGATMRHREAGLAIPDFPLAFGRLVPPFTSAEIAIHFAHRAWAWVVTAAVAAVVWRVWRGYRDEPALARSAGWLAALVLAQIALGATTIWTQKAVVPATLHVLNGALVLAASLVVTMQSWRCVARRATPMRAQFRDLVDLTKPRITLLVLVTTYVGFHLGSRGGFDWTYVAHLLIGTGLVCGGTSTLNQWWERDLDARMRRTAKRPLPGARLSADAALAFGVALAVVGLVELAAFVNLLAAVVAAFTLVTYVFVYTPLKTRTWLCTVIGAVPGALPPVIGWAAARGTLDAGAWSLFAILFIWQLPHFYAISWMYRDDYARGGFPMLAVVDTTGSRTTRHIVGWTLALVPASLLPALLGLAGAWYVTGAVALGLGFVALAAALAAHTGRAAARRVFLGSILYLPVLFALLVLDRMPPV